FSVQRSAFRLASAARNEFGVRVSEKAKADGRKLNAERSSKRPAALVPRGDGVGPRRRLLGRRLVGRRDAGRGQSARRDGLDGLARGHVLAVAQRLLHHLLLE